MLSFRTCFGGIAIYSRSNPRLSRGVKATMSAAKSNASAAATTGMNGLGAKVLAAVHAPPAAPLGDQPVGSFVSPISISLALVLLLNGAKEGSASHK